LVGAIGGIDLLRAFGRLADAAGHTIMPRAVVAFSLAGLLVVFADSAISQSAQRSAT
jgi:hypothetical protein